MLYISKIIQNITVFFTVIIAAVNFISCGDDIVYVAKEEFDPPRFNWRSMEFPNTGYADIWALDTNNIYMLNHTYRSLYKLNNGNVSTFYIGVYGFNQMQGISNNEIYIFGCEFGVTPTIIKWDGGGYTYHPTNITMPGSSGINNKHFLRNSNEIWICSKSGIAKFDGEDYEYFAYDDTTMTPDGIFLSESNTIQYICSKIDNSGEFTQVLYELQGNIFIILFEYTHNPNIIRSTMYLKEIRGNKFGIKINQPEGASWSMCYNDFNNNAFSPRYCFSDELQYFASGIRSNNPIGYNLNNYMMLVVAGTGIFYNYRTGIIHWDGNKFSKELGTGGTGSLFYETFILFNICANSYLMLEPNIVDAKSTLYIGTRN